MTGSRQYLRKCSLIVSNDAGAGIDLSNLGIKFSVKKSDAQTPNTAEIRVYNVAQDTAARIREEFTRVRLQAGYEGNFGVIFDGNIKQAVNGQENGCDKFVDIYAGDGDDAYNFSIINYSLAAGSTQSQQLTSLIQAMESRGVKTGSIEGLLPDKLPRGKVMYGMARDYIRQIAQSSQTSWSVQDMALQVIPFTSLLPNQAVVLNSKSGMIGIPEQTNEGIKIKCLLNPLLKIGSKVKINEEDIQKAKIDDTAKDSNVNKPSEISRDGFYRLYTVEHSGDTRGNEWYSSLKCLDVDATVPPAKSVNKT